MLRSDSALLPAVNDGLAAVKKADRDYIDADVRTDFADSLDLDHALQQGHEQEHRWDYLLGHAPSAQVIALEPHSAKQDEVTTLIKKRRAALDQLKPHLRTGGRISCWLWVASGDVHFADTERARKMLDENGILFVGKRVRSSHLPESPAGPGEPGRAPARKATATKKKVRRR